MFIWFQYWPLWRTVGTVGEARGRADRTKWVLERFRKGFYDSSCHSQPLLYHHLKDIYVWLKRSLLFSKIENKTEPWLILSLGVTKKWFQELKLHLQGFWRSLLANHFSQNLEVSLVSLLIICHMVEKFPFNLFFFNKQFGSISVWIQLGLQ